TATILEIEDLCGPGSIIPKANVQACGSSAPEYIWTFEDGIPATSSELEPGEIEFSGTGEKTVSLEVISSCGNVLITETFMVNEIPELDAGEDLEICNGEEITLTPILTPDANYTYRWTSTPSGMNSNLANPTVSPNQTTTYSLLVENQNTRCSISDQITVTVIPAPVIEFSIPDQTVCSGEPTLPVSISSNPAGATMEWTSEPNGLMGVSPSGTNEIPEQILINNGPEPVSVTYTA